MHNQQQCNASTLAHFARNVEHFLAMLTSLVREELVVQNCLAILFSCDTNSIERLMIIKATVSESKQKLEEFMSQVTGQKKCLQLQHQEKLKCSMA